MTSPVFQIIDAKAFHCGRIMRLLRKEAANALLMTTQDGHRELRACFDGSSFRKAWLIDGQLAGLGGVIGTELSSAGFIWLALSQEATRYPLAIVAEARRQIAVILMTKRTLVTTVNRDDRTAERFAMFMGFERHDRHADGRDVWVMRRADDILVRQQPPTVETRVLERMH